jgi:hypothetical protein
VKELKKIRSIKKIFEKEKQFYCFDCKFNFRRISEGDTADHGHHVHNTLIVKLEDINIFFLFDKITHIQFTIEIIDLDFVLNWINKELSRKDYNYTHLEDIIIQYSIRKHFYRKLEYFNQPLIVVKIKNSEFFNNICY